MIGLAKEDKTICPWHLNQCNNRIQIFLVKGYSIMSLDKQLKGKRILLKATVIYGGKSKVPTEKVKLKL